jgi:WhiB family redox-sensing transcriptional regulator
MTITTTKPSTGSCPPDPHTARADGRSNRDRSTRPGLHDRPNHRPSLSTTIEREHVVFTRSPVLAQECAQITGNPSMAGDIAATQIATPGAIDVSDDDHFLLDQPRHIAERLPCRTQNADLWFAETPAELDQAKSFCADCPARRACLAGAVARREPWGVWGGEIFDRGAIIARKRPRGRPRKDEVAA